MESFSVIKILRPEKEREIELDKITSIHHCHKISNNLDFNYVNRLNMRGRSFASGEIIHEETTIREGIII